MGKGQKPPIKELIFEVKTIVLLKLVSIHHIYLFVVLFGDVLSK